MSVYLETYKRWGTELMHRVKEATHHQYLEARKAKHFMDLWVWKRQCPPPLEIFLAESLRMDPGALSPL